MEESPIFRDAVLPDLLTCAGTPGDEIEYFQKKHLIDIINEFGVFERLPSILTQIVADELGKFGIEHEVSSRSSRSKSRKSPRGRNGKEREPLNGLNRLAEVELRSSNIRVSIPFIIKETCDFIRRHITEEGILRKSGSSSRAACIMQRFMTAESGEYFSTFDTVHDVANVLKQYLREMDVPLIPHNIHSLFIQCLDLLPENARSDAILLCTCLIPQQSIGILSFVMEFLTEVADYSTDNLMTRENLAIVMGPNIMPPETRKHDNKGKDSQQSERHLVDLRNKVVETLIINAENVGRVSHEVEKRVEAFVSSKSSEDELENEGGGRRKKRRSGSLNRMLGFLKKVTSGKGGGETPIIPSTPCGDSFSHTPIIKGSSRKRAVDDNLFALHKKVRKNALYFKDGDAKSDVSSTPNTNTLANLVACPSPAICFHPSPMRADWKQTPNGNRLKNFVTPSLLRKRVKHPELEMNAFSAPAKPSKPRLRFGRKGAKKQEENHDNETQALLHKRDHTTSSTISIHKLTNSPRSTLQRNPSSRIPRPEKSGPIEIVDGPISKTDMQNDNVAEGDYVTICSTAEINDEKNEAFIASSISLTDSEYEPLNLRRINDTASSSLLTDDSIWEPPRTREIVNSSIGLHNPLQLTPLIQEIDTLTRTAQELTLSTLKGNSASSLRSIRSRTLPESPTEPDTTPINVESVENKFIRTMNETKIMQIRSANMNRPTNVHRRLSVQDRGMSPSRRRILSSARRRSHEIGRITPNVASPGFISLRSLGNQQPVINASCSTLKRSPTRCTLKRGRPNTARVGLARPSPVRNTPRSGVINRSVSCSDPNKSNAIESSRDYTSNNNNTPLRRMSSVQELVHKLEKHRQNKLKAETSQLNENTCSRSRSNSVLPILPDPSPTGIPESVPVKLAEETNLTNTNAKEENKLSIATEEQNWVAAHNFGFERKDLRGLRRNVDRDSIHVLKTLHAGKVPATVEYFNKIGKHPKSPGRSLIPRYTALHKSGSSKSSLDSAVRTPEQAPCRTCPGSGTSIGSTERLSRRLSAADIRQKHEQLLQNIKKEKAVKRSATTVGSYNLRRTPPHDKRLMEKPKLAARPVLTSTSSARRPSTLELQTSQSPRPVVARGSFRTRTPIAQTPTINEEDESLTVSVQKAIVNLLGPTTNKNDNRSNSRKPSPIPLSPLKPSNLANINQRRPTVPRSCKKGSPNLVSPLAKTNSNTGTIIRTISERGTKATSTTPRNTPKIKKALTTRAYDMMGTPLTPRCLNLKSSAHTCQTITPRRRVPRPATNEPHSHTPLKATHTINPNLKNI